MSTTPPSLIKDQWISEFIIPLYENLMLESNKYSNLDMHLSVLLVNDLYLIKTNPFYYREKSPIWTDWMLEKSDKVYFKSYNEKNIPSNLFVGLPEIFLYRSITDLKKETRDILNINKYQDKNLPHELPPKYWNFFNSVFEEIIFKRGLDKGEILLPHTKEHIDELIFEDFKSYLKKLNLEIVKKSALITSDTSETADTAESYYTQRKQKM